MVDTGLTDDLTNTNSFWIYDPDLNAYGMIDAASVTNVTNDATSVQADIDFSPIVHIGVVPSAPGPLNNINNVYKTYDSDPLNYIETDAIGGNTFAMNLPSVPVRGTVTAIRVGIIVDNAHATKSRKVELGIWNKDQTAGAGWINGKVFTITTACSHRQGGLLDDFSTELHGC